MLTTKGLPQRLHVGRGRGLDWIAVILSSFPFLSTLMLMGLMAAAAYAGQGPLSALFYIPLFYISRLFFSQVSVYATVSLAGILLCAVALIWRPSHRGARIGALVVIALILAFPWLFSYQPALVAAPGLATRWVTQPGLFESVVKASDRLADVRPCDYQLLGWEADNRFFYQETCGGTVQLWQYDPYGVGTRAPVSAAPAALSREVISRDYLLAQLLAVGVRPQSVEPATRAVLLSTGQDNGYRSPDRHWMAVVVQHLYGPQDIVIVGQ